MTVEIRDSEVTPWRPAPWLDPRSVESTNKQFYGWQKFRLTPTESEQSGTAENIPQTSASDRTEAPRKTINRKDI